MVVSIADQIPLCIPGLFGPLPKTMDNWRLKKQANFVGKIHEKSKREGNRDKQEAKEKRKLIERSKREGMWGKQEAKVKEKK